MSEANVHRGPWDVVEQEPEVTSKDIDRHADAVQKAVDHAKGHADNARDAAAEAAKHAGRLDELEDRLKRVEALLDDAKALGDRSTEVLSTVAQSVQALAEQMNRTHGEGMQRVAEAIKASTAPRRIVRDKDGRAAGVEVGR